MSPEQSTSKLRLKKISTEPTLITNVELQEISNSKFKIYYSTSCASSKKVRKWFRDRAIPTEERNVLSDKLSHEEIRYILIRSESGFNDIVSQRSGFYVKQRQQLLTKTFEEMINYIIDNPQILKRPIIIPLDPNLKIQIGYNRHDIELYNKSNSNSLSNYF